MKAQFSERSVKASSMKIIMAKKFFGRTLTQSLIDLRPGSSCCPDVHNFLSVNVLEQLISNIYFVIKN